MVHIEYNHSFCGWALLAFFIALASIRLVFWIYVMIKGSGTKAYLEGWGWIPFFLIIAFIIAVEVVLDVWNPTNKKNWTHVTQIPFVIDGVAHWWKYLTYVGIGLGAFDTLLFLYVHWCLGLSWSGTIEEKNDHKLVTHGAYRIARHPMYVVVALIPVVVFLIIGNWLVTLAWSLMFFYCLTRIPTEEKLMIKLFGHQYIEYRQHVGALLPFAMPCCDWPGMSEHRISTLLINSEQSPLVV